MNPRPKAVSVLEEYQLSIQFDNGEKKVFDMRPYLSYPVYQELQDENIFKEAKVEYGTVVWSDEIDIDPDRLYLESSSCPKINP